MTMPASQPVDGMPEYVKHWIDNAQYWRPTAGSQDTWRDAILWLATSFAASQVVVQAVEQWTHGHLSSDDLDQALQMYQQGRTE